MASNGVNNVFEDLLVLNPNTFSSTPKFWDFLYSEHMRLLARLKSVSPEEEFKELQKQADEEIRKKLGSRLKSIALGGAMSSEEVKSFLKRVFGFEPNDGYGQYS